MITKLKKYNENILVPRKLKDRQEKLKQETIKILQQEELDGDFELEDYMCDIDESLVKTKVIDGAVYMSEQNMSELPKWLKNIKVGAIEFIENPNLKSLKNLPIEIDGDIHISQCRSLESLVGCPENVSGNFTCYYNKLNTLKGCPQIINGFFDCSSNNLSTLEYGPKIVRDIYICNNNSKKLQYHKDCKICGNFIN